MREEIVKLDGANGDEREDFEVEAGPHGGGKGVLCGAAKGLMSAADQKMSERRDWSGEPKLRAEQIRFQMRVHSQDRPRGVAIIGGDSEWAEQFYGAGSLPAVEVKVLSSGWAAGDRA